jgi:hypothetical protein
VFDEADDVPDGAVDARRSAVVGDDVAACTLRVGGVVVVVNGRENGHAGKVNARDVKFPEAS